MLVQMQCGRHQQTREPYERNQCQGKRALGTINSAIYSHLSTKQQMHKSNLLANISSECTSITLFSPTATPSTSAEVRQEGACHYSNPAQRSLALFSGEVIREEKFSVTINTVNQSPPLPPP